MENQDFDQTKLHEAITEMQISDQIDHVQALDLRDLIDLKDPLVADLQAKENSMESMKGQLLDILKNRNCPRSDQNADEISSPLDNYLLKRKRRARNNFAHPIINLF